MSDNRTSTVHSASGFGATDASPARLWSSMTGYAQIEIPYGQHQLRLQIKSVNHRFFEFRYRAPRALQMAETEIRNWCKETLLRGSVDFYVEESEAHARGTEGEAVAASTVSPAQDFFARLSHATFEARTQWHALGLDVSSAASLLARRPELWLSEGNEVAEAAPAATSDLEHPVRELCRKLWSLRATEGEETRRAVVAHGMDIRKQWTLIRAELPGLQEAWRRGLEERLAKLSESLNGATLEPARIYQEFLLLADKRDVSEELQRIDAHLIALDALAEAPPEIAVGKRLDFLAQELNREWSTLNNKILDPRLARAVGEAKLAIEKIREQCLNLV